MVAVNVELWFVSLPQIKLHGFRLAKSGGEIDAAITRQQCATLQFPYHTACQALLAQCRMCPDTFQLCGMRVKRFVSTGRNDFAITLQHQK
ncbi:hypothetical protein D3C76_1533930 [compost metagenome]